MANIVDWYEFENLSINEAQQFITSMSVYNL